jgi:hypothetical protein
MKSGLRLPSTQAKQHGPSTLDLGRQREMSYFATTNEIHEDLPKTTTSTREDQAL